MKKHVFLFLALFTGAIASAQSRPQGVTYQGEVVAGYSFGVSTFDVDRLNVHMINGIRFAQNFSAGLGLGLDYYCTGGMSTLALPVYVNVKGDMPFYTERAGLFLSVDAGYAAGLNRELSGRGGFLITPALGAYFKVSPENSLRVSLGYNHQAFRKDGISANFESIALRVGFAF